MSREVALECASRLVAAQIRAGAAASRSDVIKLAEKFNTWISEGSGPSPRAESEPSAPPAPSQGTAPPPSAAGGEVERGAWPPPCPQCGGAMHDTREDKKNPKAPDARCKDPGCKKDGYRTGAWLPKGGGYEDGEEPF